MLTEIQEQTNDQPEHHLGKLQRRRLGRVASNFSIPGLPVAEVPAHSGCHHALLCYAVGVQDVSCGTDDRMHVGHQAALLAGGDKRTQSDDIDEALRLARNL